VARPGADADERSRALVASYAVACAMDGIPAIYFHSMIGSRNWTDGPARLGYNRAINRQRPLLDELDAELADPASMRALSMAGLSSLLSERAKRPAFAPGAARKAYPAEGSVFLLERGYGEHAVLVAINCGSAEVTCMRPGAWRHATRATNPVNGSTIALETDKDSIELPGYGVLWFEL